MIRRRGATLVEVLVAIFVMAIGMLALLVLFPIGVLTMRQAIQDDRSAAAAAEATSIAKIRISPSSFDSWFTRAEWDFPPPALGANPLILSPAVSDGPSYPLFLDNVGMLNFTKPYSDWVGGQQWTGIRRLPYAMPLPVQPQPPANPVDALLWSISPDDILFESLDMNTTGQPVQIVANKFERNSAYSWAYLVRRPMQGQPNVVDLTVVVFNDRPLTMNNLGQGGETLYNSTFNLAANSATLTWGGLGEPATPPPVNIGGWILDTTPVQDPNAQGKYLPGHARFYRVVSITQTTANSVDLELQSPLKFFPVPVPNFNPPGPPTPSFAGTVVIIEGIAEVFEKGPVQWQNP